MAGSSPSPKRHDVVTAFLWDGARILLALRSQQVSTFPGHWAGISGYIEDESPLERAVIEIGEECGVPPEAVVLCGAGEPLDVPAGNVTFRVHPFLFRLHDTSGLRHDWEALRFEWIGVDEFLSGQPRPTVPQLHEAFGRVWPPWPVERCLAANVEWTEQQLAGDRASGASQLAKLAGRRWINIARLIDADRFDEFRPELFKAAERLGRVRPAMAAPGNLLDDLAGVLEANEEFAAFCRAADRLLQNVDAAEIEAARRAADLLPDGGTIMTISNSGTVAATLELAGAKLRRVYVCEGRPLCEGRQLAARLAAAGVAVTLITDAEAWQFLPRVDGVLLGADTVHANHDVINKTGSTLLALAAADCRKPVWVAAARLKFARGELAEEAGEPHDAAEVWHAPPPGVEVENRYFERVPNRLITAIVTEDGLASTS